MSRLPLVVGGLVQLVSSFSDQSDGDFGRLLVDQNEWTPQGGFPVLVDANQWQEVTNSKKFSRQRRLPSGEEKNEGGHKYTSKGHMCVRPSIYTVFLGKMRKRAFVLFE